MPLRVRRAPAARAACLDAAAGRDGSRGTGAALRRQGRSGRLARRGPGAVPAGRASRRRGAHDEDRGAPRSPQDPAHLPDRLSPARRSGHPQVGVRRQAGRRGGPHREGPAPAGGVLRRPRHDGQGGPDPVRGRRPARGAARVAARSRSGGKAGVVVGAVAGTRPVPAQTPKEEFMSTSALPAPVVRRPDAPPPNTAALERALRERVDGEVRFDAGSRAAYSTDASNFRQTPIGVVVPRSVAAAVEAVAVCREHGVPLLSRGGGTSLAGECTNAAVVLDFSKYCTRLVSVDPDARTCVVEPGIVLDELNRQLASHGLEFGSEPATHNHCTIGGMIGNNSCGATAQRTGKVVDNVVSLDVVLPDGTRMTVGRTSDEEYAEIVRAGGRRAEVYRQLRALRDEYADLVRERYPDIPRRVSGYALDS